MFILAIVIELKILTLLNLYFTVFKPLVAVMRPLTDDETEKFFQKLSKYIGENIRHLIEREDGVINLRFNLINI